MSPAVRDVATRALHTFWQAFVAAFAAAYVASGVDLAQITDLSSAKRAVLALLAAVGASVLSAAKSTVRNLATAGSRPDDPVAVQAVLDALTFVAAAQRPAVPAVAPPA